MTLVPRESLPPLVVERTAAGWKTPEVYVNVRPLGLTPGDAQETLRSILVPEMAKKCGVPEQLVFFHGRMSWVDPRGRLVFWLEAMEPVKPAIEQTGVIDI